MVLGLEVKVLGLRMRVGLGLFRVQLSCGWLCTSVIVTPEPLLSVVSQ